MFPSSEDLSEVTPAITITDQKKATNNIFIVVLFVLDFTRLLRQSLISFSSNSSVEPSV